MRSQPVLAVEAANPVQVAEMEVVEVNEKGKSEGLLKCRYRKSTLK